MNGWFRRKKTPEKDPFRQLEANYPILAQWGGILPVTPTYRHELWAIDCREGSQKFRADNRLTHEFWIAYRPVGKPNKIYLLHRGQYAVEPEASISRSNWIAKEMTRLIARLMLDMEATWLLECEGEMPILFWSMLIEKSFNQIRVETQKRN